MNIKQHIKRIGGFDKLPESKQALAKELIALEEKYAGKSVICTEYQLGRGELGFEIEMKKLRRKNCLVECDFVIKTNFDSISNGRLFIVDEKATDDNLEKQVEFKKNQAEQQEVEGQVSENVANALKELGNVAKKGKKQQY